MYFYSKVFKVARWIISCCIKFSKIFSYASFLLLPISLAISFLIAMRRNITQNSVRNIFLVVWLHLMQCFSDDGLNLSGMFCLEITGLPLEHYPWLTKGSKSSCPVKRRGFIRAEGSTSGTGECWSFQPSQPFVKSLGFGNEHPNGTANARLRGCLAHLIFCLGFAPVTRISLSHPTMLFGFQRSKISEVLKLQPFSNKAFPQDQHGCVLRKRHFQQRKKKMFC